MNARSKWIVSGILTVFAGGCATQMPSMAREYQEQPVATASADELPLGAGDTLGKRLFSGDELAGGPTEMRVADIRD